MKKLFSVFAFLCVFLSCARTDKKLTSVDPACKPPPAVFETNPSACVFNPQNQWQRCCVYQDVHVRVTEGEKAGAHAICDFLFCSQSCFGDWEQGPSNCQYLTEASAY